MSALMHGLLIDFLFVILIRCNVIIMMIILKQLLLALKRFRIKNMQLASNLLQEATSKGPLKQTTAKKIPISKICLLSTCIRSEIKASCLKATLICSSLAHQQLYGTDKSM